MLTPKSPFVRRSLYNTITIEKLYLDEIGLRVQNTFELNNKTTILLRSELERLKNVNEDVQEIHKRFYNTIRE